MTREIQLTKGFVALVDDEDYEWLNRYKWYEAVGYAGRNVTNPAGGKTRLLMHREILGLGYEDASHVDHINRNRLDNHRANLRICLNAENRRNQKAQSGGYSRFKGVTWHKRDSKWLAHIRYETKLHFLGYYKVEEGAARAYDKAALQYFGEFACTNEALGLL
jgi:hypothetical protein